MRAIVAAIHARVPGAKLAIFTVPNQTYRSAAGEAPAQKQVISAFDDTMRAAIIATGAIVVDLQCEPGMYDNANFANPWDVHPMNPGHAIIAADVIAQLAHQTAPGHCQWENPNL